MPHPYAVEADLNLDDRRLVELTDTEQATGVKDAALIARLLEEADALVDERLFARYQTPIPAPIPTTLKYIAADIARFLLFKHRDALNIPEAVQKAYDEAKKRLDEFGDGKVPLNSPRISAPVEWHDTIGHFDSDIDDRVFGRQKDGP